MSVTTPALCRGPTEINHQHASTGLDDSCEFGDELSARRLAEMVVLAVGHPPIECKGPKVAPVARNIEFANADGTKVAIAY